MGSLDNVIRGGGGIKRTKVWYLILTVLGILVGFDFDLT